MNWLFVTLTVLIVIAAVLLVLVVLLQNGKGDGMASNFVAANNVLGVRQAANELEKATWYLVSFILIAAIASSFTLGNGGSAAVDITDQVENVTEQQPAFPSAPVSQEAPATESAE
ncbi:MAG: preprotein translocase subunit SecG [Bacteroidales bacterium]|jgi:preprotein translocase subunit SecG|nr:preprotein translocase subunit SecG [Bacteroidales bacterium]MEE3406943.1 preprotein translocase subunit SecG [Candidatus Cryptobacteroides sp.]SKC35562.1 preprotein translocase subunit SecG [Bacteroidales bacterium WCE2008]MBO7366963.1 preprotein translocase subunit SecG [Bacteroidales bacterium]MBO7622827.1 preprotein translocase subunit SecG [Bacteroidales bacterium]